MPKVRAEKKSRVHKEVQKQGESLTLFRRLFLPDKFISLYIIAHNICHYDDTSVPKLHNSSECGVPKQ